MTDDTLGTTDGEGAAGDKDPGGADETKSPRNMAGTGDRGGASARSIRDGTMEPED